VSKIPLLTPRLLLLHSRALYELVGYCLADLRANFQAVTVLHTHALPHVVTSEESNLIPVGNTFSDYGLLLYLVAACFVQCQAHRPLRIHLLCGR